MFSNFFQWAMALPLYQSVMVGMGLWVALTCVTIICTFSVNAYDLWLKSRLKDEPITAYQLGRYEAHELGFVGTLILWPLVFIVIVPMGVVNAIADTFNVLFVSRMSTIRIIPHWCSLEGLAKILNAGRRVDQ